MKSCIDWASDNFSDATWACPLIPVSALKPFNLNISGSMLFRLAFVLLGLATGSTTAHFANDRRQNAVSLDSCQSSTITVNSELPLGWGTIYVTDAVVTNIVYVTVWASASTITSTLSQCPADSNHAKSPTAGSSTFRLSLSDISSASGPILQATGTSLSSTISSLVVNRSSTIKSIFSSTTQVSTISTTVTTSSYSCNVLNQPPPDAGTVQMSGVSKSIWFFPRRTSKNLTPTFRYWRLWLGLLYGCKILDTAIFARIGKAENDDKEPVTLLKCSPPWSPTSMRVVRWPIL